jgi:hypothetical protein
VTPPTLFSPDEGSARVQWKERSSGNLFSAVVHRARVCLVCGHVALALDGHQLAKVRAAIGGLASV